MQFTDLGLSKTILRAISEQGYEIATPIQAQTIGHALQGKDVLGCAQTGTGKTAAFALPVLHQLSQTPAPKQRAIRALVLCPTRELASQIDESFRNYGKGTGIRSTVVFGGVGQWPQVKALKNGVDVLVATPGRLLDLMQQGHVDLRNVHSLVLDEADRMLDMGFINDIRKVIAEVPQDRQTLLFSATMPEAIRKLSMDLLRNPVTVQVKPDKPAAERIAQTVCHVAKHNKSELLLQYLDNLSMYKTIVFTRTKHGADKVVRHLKRGGVSAEAIHGNKTQNKRRATLDRFTKGKIEVLVATDVAARGVDIDDVTHVVNYDVPRDAESYVHRIGRTARAGAEGSAITFCDHDEYSFLLDVQKLIRMEIERRDDSEHLMNPPANRPRKNKSGGKRGNGGGSGGAGGAGGGGNRRSSRRSNTQGAKGKSNSGGRVRRDSGAANRSSDKPKGGKTGPKRRRRRHPSANSQG